MYRVHQDRTILTFHDAPHSLCLELLRGEEETHVPMGLMPTWGWGYRRLFNNVLGHSVSESAHTNC